MRVGSSGRKRRWGLEDEFTATNYNQPQTNKNSLPHLSDLCLTKIAKLLFQCRPLKLPVKLPTELQEKILQTLAQQNFLNNYTIVPLISSELTRLDLTNKDRSLRPFHPNLIHSCLKLCTSLQFLNLNGCYVLPETWNLICSQPVAQNLRELNVRGCKSINDEVVRKIILFCNRLESLNLKATSISDSAFDIQSELTQSDSLPTISQLTLSTNLPSRKRKRDIFDETAFKQELDLTDSEVATQHLISPITDDKKEISMNDIVISSKNSLPEVLAPKCTICVRDTVSCIQFPHLTKLTISGCTKITNKGIERLASLFPVLLHFNCAHCSKITSVNPIIFRCQHLVYLNISDTSVEAIPDPSELDQDQLTVEELWRRYPNSLQFLRTLKFSGTQLMDSGFSQWFMSCGRSLQELQLRNKNAKDLVQWLVQSKQLKVLDLYGVPLEKRVDSMINVLRNNALTLEVLDLTHTGILPNDLLSAVGTIGFPFLRSLTLSIDKKGLRPGEQFTEPLFQLGLLCPNVKNLCINLSQSHLFDVGEILRILEGFRKLQTVEFWACRNVTYALVEKIPKKCPHLETVLLCRVTRETPTGPCLSDHEFELLKIKYPTIQFKIWQHSIYGKRFFQYSEREVFGQPQGSAASCGVNTLQLKVDLASKSLHELREALREATQSQLQGRDGDNIDDCLLKLITTEVYVDNIPIWSNEQSACMPHLVRTTEGNSGAIPLISDWCCGCNIEWYNGVLYYDTTDENGNFFVNWEIHEPGAKKHYRFAKNEYVRVISTAKKYHSLLLRTLKQQNFSSLEYFCRSDPLFVQ
jgi:hypothetical protein